MTSETSAPWRDVGALARFGWRPKEGFAAPGGSRVATTGLSLLCAATLALSESTLSYFGRLSKGEPRAAARTAAATAAIPQGAQAEAEGSSRVSRAFTLGANDGGTSSLAITFMSSSRRRKKLACNS